jgi:Fe-S-cluster containining protein
MFEVVVRPLWREFTPDRLRAAAQHAKAGGLSVVKDQRWKLLGDAGPPGEDLPPLVDWAIRAIESSRWGELEEGPAKGCVEAPITRDWRVRVQEWIDRDKAFPGSTTEAKFDCMLCGACCYDNQVVIDEQDMKRFRDGGRQDLIKRLSRKGVVRLLPLVRSKDKPCVHLEKKMCTVYEVRPNMCRDFLVGTEQCITSREDLYGEPFPAGK